MLYFLSIAIVYQCPFSFGFNFIDFLGGGETNSFMLDTWLFTFLWCHLTYSQLRHSQCADVCPQGRSLRSHGTKANVQYVESVNILQVEQLGKKCCTHLLSGDIKKKSLIKISLNLSPNKVIVRFRNLNKFKFNLKGKEKNKWCCVCILSCLIISHVIFRLDLAGGSDGKEFACNAEDLDSIPGLGRAPGGEHGNPLQYSCLKNPHGQRNLASGYSPCSRKESDTTEWLSIAQYLDFPLLVMTSLGSLTITKFPIVFSPNELSFHWPSQSTTIISLTIKSNIFHSYLPSAFISWNSFHNKELSHIDCSVRP